MKKPTHEEISIAIDYIKNRKVTVDGVNIPESIEAFYERKGYNSPSNPEYALDCASVQLYPHERNYLSKKWGDSI